MRSQIAAVQGGNSLAHNAHIVNTCQFVLRGVLIRFHGLFSVIIKRQAHEHGQRWRSHRLRKIGTAQLANDLVGDEQLELAGVVVPPLQTRGAPAASNITGSNRTALAEEAGFEINFCRSISISRVLN